MAEQREEYGKEMAELREKYDALQQRVLGLEVAQTGRTWDCSILVLLARKD